MIEQKSLILTKKVLDYQQTGRGFDALQKELSLKAYFYPKNKLKWNMDLCSDFYLFLYPSIIRSIHMYRNQGRSFDHYFNSTLCWQLLAYIRQRKNMNTVWRSAWQPDFWDIPWLENADSRDSGKVRRINLKRVLQFNKNNKICYESEKQQFLFFTLKKAGTMTERDIRYITAVTGYGKEWINVLVEQLKLTMQHKEKRFKMYVIRRKAAFAKMLLLGKSLETECDPEKRIQMQKKIVKLRVVYNRACYRISRIQLTPSQEAIARVTGYSKGTVDYAIGTFRKKVLRVYMN